MHQNAESSFFEFDREACFLLVTCNGFWTRDVLKQFKPAFAKECRAERQRKGRLAVLCDARKNILTTPEVAAGFQKVSELTFVETGGVIAVVLSSALTTLQLKRVYEEDDRVVFFGDYDEARDYLNSLAQG